MNDRTAVPPEFQNTNGTGATNRQINYLTALLQEREMDAEARALLSRRVGAQIVANEEQGEGATIDNGVSKRRASEFIARLLAKPKRTDVPVNAPRIPRSGDGLPEAPAGRYALKEEDGITRFYRVDRPTEGRWAGYTFLKIQASDDLHPIKDRVRKFAVLKAISEDPPAASRLYGQELGHCGVCGRTLTDETSREYGIGPVCRAATGW